MTFNLANLMPIAVAFVASLALTPVVRAGARRTGVVARAKADRWHKKPTALLGGLAIFATVACVLLLFVPLSSQALVILGGSTLLFLLGLLDDFLTLKPYQKLIGQVIGAAIVVSFGLTLRWTASPGVNLAITIFWLVGITNAVNLLDNMDGLATGIAAISSVFLTVLILGEGQLNHALMLAVFGAALLGFLVYNTNPASIFMGDCGSMFIGFFLASSTLLVAGGGRTRSFLPVLAVPVLVLLIPIFDTLFVVVLRKLAGRSISQGGRDHTSHRLVALGLSERRAVLMLYGLATVSGLLGLWVGALPFDLGVAALIVITLALTLLGVHLAEVKVYDEREVEAARKKPLIAFFLDLSFKRRIFEVMLDLTLIVLSYHLANALTFGSVADGATRQQFLYTVPVLIVVKLVTFLAMGVYRGLWRYIGLEDVVVLGKAVFVGSVASILVLLFAFRFQGFSRVVFVLDGLILLTMLTGSRMTFRLLRRYLRPAATTQGRRVLIYGAGDAGELLLRELRNNRDLQCLPIGFADDDPTKKGKVIHGLRVLGGNGSFLSICRDNAIDDVLISSRKFSHDRLEEIARVCETAAVGLKRMRIHLEQLEEEDSPSVAEPSTAADTSAHTGTISDGLIAL
jgi:UDP-GlcNAc:undecaprenyl-phosphate GlcNAc-1-phosphate transferase